MPMDDRYRKVLAILTFRVPTANMTSVRSRVLPHLLAIALAVGGAGCQILTENPPPLVTHEPPVPDIRHEVSIAPPALPPAVTADSSFSDVPAEVQADLWSELRARMSLSYEIDRNSIQAELRWLKRHPKYLMRLQPRMQRYLPYVMQQVAARNLPGELALLPIIESALDPYAFSPGGAAGLWQIMPRTGTRFGLQQNWWQDQRRDPVAATQAALDYLQILHTRFDDWLLAVAGYNAGEGNVSRARRRAPANSSFWDLKLPRETRAYVPRLLAVSAVIADPERFELQLPNLTAKRTFVEVSTHDQFDLLKAAEALGTDVETLYDWNPSLNQWATAPAGPHRLLVPAHLEPEAQQRIDSVPANNRLQWLRLEVARGDTLSGIANKHNTDVATLKRVNNLRGTTIRIGDALFVPGASADITNFTLASRRGTASYSVKPGDSLWSISRAFDVSMTHLMKLNQVGPRDVLRIGQEIRIPGGREVVRIVNYRVRRGDSLARIAARFDVTVADIARWNSLDTANYLRPGQRMKLHVKVVGAAD